MLKSFEYNAAFIVAKIKVKKFYMTLESGGSERKRLVK